MYSHHCLNLNQYARICKHFVVRTYYSIGYDELCSLQPADVHMQCSLCVQCTQYDHHVYCLGCLAGGLLADSDCMLPRLWDTSQICEYISWTDSHVEGVRSSIVACRTIIEILLGCCSVCLVLRCGEIGEPKSSITIFVSDISICQVFKKMLPTLNLSFASI